MQRRVDPIHDFVGHILIGSISSSFSGNAQRFPLEPHIPNSQLLPIVGRLLIIVIDKGCVRGHPLDGDGILDTGYFDVGTPDFVLQRRTSVGGSPMLEKHAIFHAGLFALYGMLHCLCGCDTVEFAVISVIADVEFQTHLQVHIVAHDAGDLDILPDTAPADIGCLNCLIIAVLEGAKSVYCSQVGA